jgi:hypothetical protein
MMIGYKYPIFPGNIAQWKLAENLDACRWLYNQLLEDLNDAKEKGIKLESKPLYHISVRQVLAMKWEAAPNRTR